MGKTGNDPKNNTKPKEISRKTAERLFKTDIFRQIGALANTSAGKTYTILSLTFITMGFLLWFAFRPTLKTIFELDSKIKEYSSIATTLETKAQYLTSLSVQYNTDVSGGGIKEQIELLEHAVLPSQPNQDALFYDLYHISEKAGTITEQIDSSTENVPDHFILRNAGINRITVSVMGTKDAILEFGQLLDDYPRPLIVNSVSIAESSPTESLYRATIVMYVFYFEPLSE